MNTRLVAEKIGKAGRLLQRFHLRCIYSMSGRLSEDDMKTFAEAKAILNEVELLINPQLNSDIQPQLNEALVSGQLPQDEDDTEDEDDIYDAVRHYRNKHGGNCH